MDDSVLFETLPSASGKAIGIATLNRPKTLNSLTLEMTRRLDQQLEQWVTDEQIAAVVLKGAGEKAFCAGGDLHGLYQAMQAHQGQPARNNRQVCEFFAEEYALDYSIHTYPKPIVCWGDGIVMGGGVGLMGGASHRVVTETSRLAMPEISIGLFPDVGGSWLLSRAPGRTGIFLGLTGAQLGASDAIFAGLADHAVNQDQWPAFVQALAQRPWQGRYEDFHSMTEVLAALTAVPLKAGPLRQHFDTIQETCQGYELEEIAKRVGDLANHEDAWLSRAGQTYLAGCPATARLTWMLWRCARQLSLSQVFQLEWGVAIECAAQGHFQEGIRAVLIDKDRKPQWRPATLAETAGPWNAPYFATAIDDPQHPLRALGL